MKTITKTLLTAVMIPALFFISCKDDEIEQQDFSIIGTWQLINAEPDVTPIIGASMTETDLEKFLANYTFFSPVSRVIITADSITLTAELAGVQQPTMTLPYTLSKNILTIVPPILIPAALQGETSIEATTMEFDLTPTSYMNLLNFISAAFPELTSTINQIASAKIDYDFKRIQ